MQPHAGRIGIGALGVFRPQRMGTGETKTGQSKA